jgi:hypothetical protein
MYNGLSCQVGLIKIVGGGVLFSSSSIFHFFRRKKQMATPSPSIRPILLKSLKQGAGYESVTKNPEFVTLLKKTYEFLSFKHSAVGPRELGIGIILIEIVPLMTSTSDLMQWIPATKGPISEKQFIKYVSDIYNTLLPMSVMRMARSLADERESTLESGKLMNNMLDLSPDYDGYDSHKIGQTGSKTLFGYNNKIKLR